MLNIVNTKKMGWMPAWKQMLIQHIYILHIIVHHVPLIIYLIIVNFLKEKSVKIYMMI